MLVLTRRVNESVRVMVGGVEFMVTVGQLRGDKVRIVFDAPPEVKILRSELPVRSVEMSPEIAIAASTSELRELVG